MGDARAEGLWPGCQLDAPARVLCGKRGWASCTILADRQSGVKYLPMKRYPCPCCGYLKFTEPPGHYEICDICGWEDDHVQLYFPEHRGGANGASLMEAQQAYAREAAKRSPTALDPSLGETRDPRWR